MCDIDNTSSVILVTINSLQVIVPFLKEITNAKFYYLDKFILITSGNGLHLYKYQIDASKPDDIKRFVTGSACIVKLRFQVYIWHDNI